MTQQPRRRFTDAQTAGNNAARTSPLQATIVTREIAEVRQPDSASNDGVSPWAIDPKAAERLWILSEELTGMKFDS
jgi:hypothetical protein